MTGRILNGGHSNFEKITVGIGEVFFENAEKYSDNVFQIDAISGEKETFASAKLRSTRLAMSMQAIGITSEDIIVTCLKITMDTAIPHLAALYLGVKFSAIDPIQTDKEWCHCLDLVKPKLIFVDEDQVDKLERCFKSIGVKPQLIVYGKSNIHRTSRDLVVPHPGEKLFRPKVIDNCQDIAFITFSSGTTGLPKAMTISHFSMINSVQLLLETYGTKYFTVELLFSTYYWMSSMMVLTRSFFTGACRVLFSKFHPDEALKAIEKYKVSSCMIAPSAAQHLLRVPNLQDYDLSSVKLYLSVGTGISPEHLLLLRKIFSEGIVLNAYGCTEASGAVTGYNLEIDLGYALNNPKTVGKCIKDTEIKIIDEVSRELLGPNQSGAIWMKSTYRMSGYYNHSTPLKLDSDGFFETGDIGYYDEDDFVYVNGRSNNMFKYGALKVIPENWESVLENHPSIQEAGVFGIPHGSDGWYPAACIVLRDYAIITVEDINKFLNKEMTERHKLDGGIRFVQELPKTPSNKLRRKELFDVFNKATS